MRYWHPFTHEAIAQLQAAEKDKVFAFAMVLGPLNDRIWTTGAGAINMGFPAIANTDIPTIHPTGVTIYEEVAKELDPKKIVEKCIEVRGLKITLSKPPIPVPYGPAFEGAFHSSCDSPTSGR